MLLARVASSGKGAEGLRRIVLASGPADMHDWAACVAKLRAALPGNVRAALDKHEAAGTIADGEYQDAVGQFGRHWNLYGPLVVG